MARHLGRAAVHPQRGWDALRRLGWSLQSPRVGAETTLPRSAD
jgi:hypothetical protein